MFEVGVELFAVTGGVVARGDGIAGTPGTVGIVGCGRGLFVECLDGVDNPHLALSSATSSGSEISPIV